MERKFGALPLCALFLILESQERKEEVHGRRLSVAGG